MFKIKHCLIPFVGMVISFGAANVAAKSENLHENIEKELLKAITMLGKSESGTVTKSSEINSNTKVEDLVGLSLKEFMDPPKTSKQKNKASKSANTKGISKGTYKKVMAISSKRSKRSSRRYRACYQYNYQELQKKSRRYQRSITEASKRYGVNENLIKSVITAESCFKVRARSHKGARGLMQLMPATARRFGVRNSYNSHQNIGAGTKYLRWLLDRFSGNVKFALAGYNAGEGKVDRYGGIPPYKETREYVRRVMGVFNTLHHKMPTSANLNYKNTTKSKAYYQKLWHQKQKSKQKTKPMNQRRCVEAAPSHLRGITYLKRSGRGGTTWRRYYRLNHSENLASVTHKTGVHVSTLQRMNRLSSQSPLRPGHQLIVWECRA